MKSIFKIALLAALLIFSYVYFFTSINIDFPYERDLEKKLEYWNLDDRAYEYKVIVKNEVPNLQRITGKTHETLPIVSKSLTEYNQYLDKTVQISGKTVWTWIDNGFGFNKSIYVKNIVNVADLSDRTVALTGSSIIDTINLDNKSYVLFNSDQLKFAGVAYKFDSGYIPVIKIQSTGTGVAEINKPVVFWREGDYYYLVITDNVAHTLGTGIAKLLKLPLNMKSFELEKCFYYTKQGFAKPKEGFSYEYFSKLIYKSSGFEIKTTPICNNYMISFLN